jgi:hypothetical protein
MNPLQRAAFRRKVIYLVAILGLFTLSMFWRGMLPIPLSSARAGEPTSTRLPDVLASHTILNKSLALELREVEQGEQELKGSAFRLALVGSRGFVVAYLWHSAMISQKRNDFHKMDDCIRTVTQLQPHFITPWVFQSWNISYNVSVEMQGSGDMYYYIARGIELLTEGERRQLRTDPETGRKIGSPDMRYWVAFYYQNKFGVSDNVETLRCLFQMSCIPPNERNGLTNADGSVDREKFLAFCVKYPHLVRRLRGENPKTGAIDELTNRRIQESLKCPRPEDVVQFLIDNKDIPSRYKSATELAEADRQFPVLPQKFNEGPDEADSEMPTKDRDDFSAFKAARAWYVYSTVSLPPMPLDDKGKPLPSATPQPGEYDPLKYRVPRQPMLIIFRQGAPRVQTAQAEMEQHEGWFDDEGWLVDKPGDQRNWWFPDQAKPVVIGGGRQRWSEVEWEAAARMWRQHGEMYGLILTPEQEENYKAAEKKFGKRLDLTSADLDDLEQRRRFQMAQALYYYYQNRSLTNFAYFLTSASCEQRHETVLARKKLWEAEEQRKLGEKTRAIKLYEQGLRLWRDVLLSDADFHRPERSDHTEEETYAFELAYLRLLVQDDDRVRSKANALVERANSLVKLIPLALSPSLAPVVSSSEMLEEAKWSIAENDPEFSPFVGPMNVDDKRKGQPWVRDYIKENIRVQQGVQRKKQPLAPEEMSGPMMQPGAPVLPGSRP